MRSSHPGSRSKQAGFTLVELLIAVAVAAVIILASTQVLTSAAQSQGREEITVPMQESVRGAMEVLSMDLREAISPRVLSQYATPTSFSAYYSTNTAVTIVGGDAISTFDLAKPSGYPATLGYPSQSSISIVSPNSAATACSTAFKGGDYFYLLSLPPGSTDQVVKVTWGQTAPSPCTGSTLNTNSVMPAIPQWTLDSRIVKAKLTRYYTGILNGQNVLYRQILGGNTPGVAQVVAFDITGLRLEYSTDGLMFAATPSLTAETRAVRISLTGQSNQKRYGTATTQPYTLTQVVFMRQTTLQKNF